MYFLSVDIDDEYFRIGKRYKIIKEEEKMYRVKTETGNLDIHKNCSAINQGRLKLIKKFGNFSLFF